VPMRPPGLRKPRRATAPTSNWNRRTSRQARGYGRAHDRMRAIVLAEEPLCRICLEAEPQRITPSTIADHRVPKSQGGTDDRENYQGVCDPCHVAKTARESADARRLNDG
jgi:5-methylcytosine-specific restriction protein A